ncbi:hypothetical protein [Spongiivirga citrea]|uniref:Lipocalin-like domain-containing protein n=1 Tax=Spongiivirga citrea TaxID=1481457 RepID=A0A6M0CGR9_9FLAO|nr:hypothetical protein [Spongiivirga citrea]NER17061.1 hypothetical protein [Spongiivirga citrea]
MKNYLVLLFGLLILCSCNDNDTLLNEELPQTWQLVRMTGSIANSETTGSDMAWQETIVFKINRKFVKTRVRDGATTSASGTFTPADPESGNIVVLTYNESNTLRASCSGDLTEHLGATEDGTTLYGTWNACDGPGLEYKRIN